MVTAKQQKARDKFVKKYAGNKGKKKKGTTKKQRNIVKSGKYKGWHVEITQTRYGKKSEKKLKKHGVNNA